MFNWLKKLFSKPEATMPIKEENKFLDLPSQHLCERLGMRREGLFMDFVSFINNPDGTPLYENTVQYAILKREWKECD